MIENTNGKGEGDIQQTLALSGMYKDWFLDYASYVILDRAVPTDGDGLKPVQRRLLHALKSMDDGRFHKVANVVGQTMQYHPHGDASIYDALVKLGQKDLLVETQGNWGDTRTGDKAAAARYIEARLSKFALEVGFNADITEWQLSYDGRKKEPIQLPIKFPLLLAMGVEGIAVGLSTKILPHNFIELLKASIKILKGKKPVLYPDFPGGGLADVENYNDGRRGGKVRVRAKIEIVDKKTLIIREIPYGNTTSSVIDSIVKANDKGKIKVKKVIDNTAKELEILIELPPNVSPDITIDALYAFTNCEVSLSPNCCVIVDKKPEFLGVSDLLKVSTENTLDLLRQELEINLKQLLEKLHFASLEQIFIENRIYRKIEECETFEAVIEAIDKGLKPFVKHFVREVTRDDILRLTEIKIKRISKYDGFKAEDQIKKLNDEIKAIRFNLANLTDYAIDYYQGLIAKYGKGRERKTEMQSFETIKIRRVAVANQKLYVNRKDGFIGYSLKKDEFVQECSDIDNIIVFRKDGKFLVTPIADKTFVGKDILHAAVWRKGENRVAYHLVYVDGATKFAYVKRFNVTSITRDKEYDLTQGTKGSRVLYFSVHPNSESEELSILLSPAAKARKKQFDFDFSTLGIKGRGSKGNILSRYPIKKITQLSLGVSTLGGRKIWYDDTIGRLNSDKRGKYLGEFDTGDLIFVIRKDGSYVQTDFELTNRYQNSEIKIIEKYDPAKVISVLYYNGAKSSYYVKRFMVETSVVGQPYTFISEEKGSSMSFVTCSDHPVIDYTYQKKRGGEKLESTIYFEDFISIKGWKSIGNKVNAYKINKITPLEEETDSENNQTAKEDIGKKIPQEDSKKKLIEKAISDNKDKKKVEKLKPGESIEWDLKKPNTLKDKDSDDKQGSLF